MTWIGRLRARRHAAELRRRAEAQDHSLPESARHAIQLEGFNREWRRLCGDSPYYRQLRSERSLPERFRSLEEFVERVPVTRRQDIQEHVRAMASRSRRPDLGRKTGGSTAAPVEMPAWNSEIRRVDCDFWEGRGWYGVTPASRLFLIWGHSHLLGSGLPGWIAARRRDLSDRLLGYLRFSAYDLQASAMRRAGDALLRFRPECVLGYGVALDHFWQANADRRERFRDLGVRAVFGTGEAFPSTETPANLEDLFGCRVGMEYGAVETGVIAHSHPDGGYRVFWRSNLIEGVGTGTRRPVLVTSLYPRCTPLVRYELGDEIEVGELPGEVGLAAFERVVGRCNDYLELPDGTRVHSEAFSHAVRPCSSIRGFQVVQDADRVRLRFTAEAGLSDAEARGLVDRLRRIHPALEKTDLERVEALPQTVAGKTRMVVRA